MTSREPTSRKFPVSLSVRDWLGIISLVLTLLGIGWRFADSIREQITSVKAEMVSRSDELGTRMSVLETKVDLLVVKQLPEAHDQRVTSGKGKTR